MTVSLLKYATGGGWFGASPLTIPISTTAGSTLVLSTTTTAGLDPIITDTAGNTWVKSAATSDVGATSQRAGSVYYCVNARAITSVSMNSASNQNWAAIISEWAGVRSFRTSVAVNTPSNEVPVPASAGDLVLSSVFYYQASGDILAPPSGWTSAGEHVTGNNYHSSAYQEANSSGNIGAPWSMPASARGIVTSVFEGEPAPVFRPWKLITASGPISLVPHRL